MSTFETNWEVGLLVTAEAVHGIGFSMELDDESAVDEPRRGASPASQSVVDAAD